MLRAINIGSLILAFMCACVIDSFVVRMVSVLACVLSAFSLGMDFGEQGE